MKQNSKLVVISGSPSKLICHLTADAIKICSFIFHALGEWLLKVLAWIVLLGVLLKQHSGELYLYSPAVLASAGLGIFLCGSLIKAVFKWFEFMGGRMKRKVRYAIELPEWCASLLLSRRTASRVIFVSARPVYFVLSSILLWATSTFLSPAVFNLLSNVVGITLPVSADP